MKKRGRQIDEEAKDDGEEPHVSTTLSSSTPNARRDLTLLMRPVNGINNNRRDWADEMDDDEPDDGSSTPVHTTSARAPNRASSSTLPMSSLGSLSSPSKITNTRTPSIRNQSPASGTGSKRRKGEK